MPCSTTTTTRARRRRSMQSKALVAAQVLVFYVLLLLLWQAVYDAHIWSRFLLPEPSRVVSALRRYVDNGVLLRAIADRLQRMLIGFVIAFVAGMVLGVGIGSARWLDRTLGSLVVGM